MMGIQIRGPFGLDACAQVGRIITATAATQDIVTIKNSSGNINFILMSSASSAEFQMRNSAATSYISLRTVDRSYFESSYGVVVGSGTQDASCVLTATSTTRGFLPPRMTTVQKAAIGTPLAGLIVFDTNLAKLCVYTGAAWETVTSA